MPTGPRQIVTPYRPIPLTVPEGMKPNEFFNSAENLADLAHNNGLLRNPEGLLLYRKALGHSNVFDTSIIYYTSRSILDPLGPTDVFRFGRNDLAFDQPLDFNFRLIRQLEAIRTEEFDAIVMVRIVTGGNHYPQIGAH